MELKKLSEENLIEFTGNMIESYKANGDNFVLNQLTSKDEESQRDNVGWYRFEDGKHIINLNLPNMMCAQFGINRGVLDLESFYAFVALCTGHEYRHYLQGTCIYDDKKIDGYDINDAFNAELMMCIRQFYDGYYLMNKGYLKYELDADQYGIIEGVKFLRENYPNVNAEKAMRDAVDFYANIQSRGFVLSTLPLGCKTYDEVVTAIAEKLRLNKRTPLEDSLCVYNPAFYQNHSYFELDEERLITEELIKNYNQLTDGSKKDLLVLKSILSSIKKPEECIQPFPQITKRYSSKIL